VGKVPKKKPFGESKKNGRVAAIKPQGWPKVGRKVSLAKETVTSRKKKKRGL